MKVAVLLALSVLLAACSGQPPAPDVVLVTEAPPPPVVPDECDPQRDPAWRDVPDADVTQSVGARTYRANKQSMRGLSARRRICWAGLKVQVPTTTRSGGRQ